MRRQSKRQVRHFRWGAVEIPAIALEKAAEALLTSALVAGAPPESLDANVGLPAALGSIERERYLLQPLLEGNRCVLSGIQTERQNESGRSGVGYCSLRTEF